ncbi:MAG: rhomboid family intramembrane serine protease [Microscillaceae bacterium]|nr:rhomboid family intramembrane serine protease [Microscillaceae bacterium]MDW8461485.1 rhomboid family intramembrane serine protease [Cytophagales bacterium]
MFQPITPVVRNLLIINILVFISSYFLRQDLLQYFSLYNFDSPNFAAYQVLTYMFLHFNFVHLFGNMLALYFFGPWLEQVMGSQRFLTYYMVTGIGAGILYGLVNLYENQTQRAALESYLANPNPDAFVYYMSKYEPRVYENAEEVKRFGQEFSYHEKDKNYIETSKKVTTELYQKRLLNHSTVGASGAVFGILIAFGLIFPNVTLILFPIPVPIRAKILVTLYILYELYAGLNPSPYSNVAHFAHLSGALIGFLLVKLWGLRGYDNFG